MPVLDDASSPTTVPTAKDRIGVEIGGTFTDLVWAGADGELRTGKTPSTPSAIQQAVLRVIEEAGRPLSAVERVTHGSTVATNALIQRKGASAGLLTTRGFRDVITIGRGDRDHDIYNMQYRRPEPPIRRSMVREVTERIAPDGSVITPLDLEAAWTEIQAFLDQGVEGIAICLLHAYRNPQHEKAVSAMIRERAPHIAVSASHEISPEFREYERSVTTVVNAFVGPVVETYIGRLEKGLADGGYSGVLQIMQSNGGVMPAAAAGSNAVRMLLSGPAAGVRAAMWYAARNGISNAITLDMGGTSTDIAIAPGLVPAMVPELKVDGLPVRTTSVDMETIGAGGGSIAAIDPGGFLAVGPESAGAQPGPACYGRGGTRPTVTDAQVIAGILPPGRFFGGRMTLDVERARAALESLDLPGGAEAAADAILRIANSNISSAVRLVSTSKGIDPRSYTLIAYGGGGPVHSAMVAEDLGIAEVLIPWSPGLTSAFGLLIAETMIDVAESDLQPLTDRTLDAGRVARLLERAERTADENGLPVEGRALQVGLDMRYAGQAFELTIWVDARTTDAATLRKLFEAEHRSRYGYARASLSVEAVAYRLRLTHDAGSEVRTPLPTGQEDLREDVDISLGGKTLKAVSMARDALLPGNAIDGPAILGGAVVNHFRARRMARTLPAHRRPAVEGPAPMNMTSPIPSGEAAAGSVDPILLTIIARALQSAADEMALNLIRSAFSAVVREARDCSTALLDAKGRVIAQAEMLPMQTAGLSLSFAACSAQLDLSKVGPDHAILLNDPYSGGQHLNDLILFSPIFLDGELLGWAGSTAHHLDIGGGSAGVNTTAEELIQEGLVIPPILMEVGRDWHGGGIERLIFANVRTPEIGRGDMDAQFASNHVGRERVLGLAERFGVDVLRAAMSEVLDYSERRMRAAIAAIPDGTWDGEAFMDSDGREPASPPVRVAVKLTIRGDEAEMDFSGTDRQVRAMFNAPIASSFASAVTALRTILSDRSIPANDGCNRPVKLNFPEGSLLNPYPGAPVRARGSAGLRVLDAVHMALSKVVPERCPAQGANATTGFFLCHTRPDGRMAIHLDVLGGGWGAAKGYDAIHVTDNVLSSCRLTPTESIEQIYSHVRLEEFGLWQDSAGAGTWRGGLGLFRQYRIMADDVTLSLYTDRFVVQPAGAGGGLSSPLSTLTVERDGKEIELSGHATFAMRKGDLVTVRLSGGGGWGDPLKRDRSQVAADLEDELISPAFARQVYGYTAA